MLVLVLNSGSSSIKFEVRDIPDDGSEPVQLLKGIVAQIGEGEVADHAQALDLIGGKVRERLEDRHIEAVGHRVVHGGEQFTEPTMVTEEVIEAVEALAPLAPLHNPAHALGMRAIQDKWPEIPQVAVFDTAFHRTMPEHVWRYAVPDELYSRNGVRRYGFHGTSHDYVTERMTQHLGIPRDQFTGIVAHLGNGASITAISNGLSSDTSMGYTPFEGLVMGTRGGHLDASIITQLIINGDYTAKDLDRMLNRESGLKGICGHSDMRDVIYEAERGDDRAELALEMTVHRLLKYIGSYHLQLGRVDGFAFTGGIGENAWQFRRRVVDRLSPLGVHLDEPANLIKSNEPRVISTPDSAFPVLVVPTDEELAIAEATMVTVKAHQAHESVEHLNA